MTRQQVLSRFRQPGAVLAIERTTYSRVHAMNPTLAASDVIYPGRVVWVITIYFLKPVAVSDPLAPAALQRKLRISAESTIVDAATGQVTDYCLGCSVVHRQAR